VQPFPPLINDMNRNANGDKCQDGFDEGVYFRNVGQFSNFPRPRGMETAGGISLPEWAGETVCGFCDSGKAWILPLYTYTRQNP